VTKKRGYAVGNNGPLLNIKNGGNNISEVETNIWAALYDIFFIDDTVGFAVGFDGKIIKISVVNDVEQITSVPSGIETPLNKVYFTSPDTGFIAGENGVVLKTTDRGKNWYVQPTSTANHLRAMYFKNKNTGYLAGSGLSILKTNNGGGGVITPYVPETSALIGKISIYPNPARNKVFVSYTLKQKTKTQIKVFNLAGQQVIGLTFTQPAGTQNTGLDISGFSNGVYLIQVMENSKITSEKLIIRNQ
jgi:photosystem II stability/assembly factor-like uncharacterized protein